MTATPPPKPPDPVLGFTRKRRVQWMEPSVLARTGMNLSISKVFGQFADKRELQAVVPVEQLNLADLGHTDTGELWLDYVSDLADGFRATMTIAHLLAQEHLDVPSGVSGAGGAAQETVHTERGAILVMGGDEVYPFGDVQAYQDRLVGPYRAALPNTEKPHPRVFAVPGNHDWYDGLTSFLRLFGGVKRLPELDPDTGCPKLEHRWIGGWQTAQRRSYFAVRLPQKWWLWGIDIQLDTYIDDPQLAFFRDVASQLGQGDAVILCSAKPSWVDAGADATMWGSYATLDFFERELIQPFGARLRVSLTGDKHFYARYEGVEPDVAGAQKVIAGGGGAYLAATHHLPSELHLPHEQAPEPKSEPRTYRLAETGGQLARYPSAATSSRLRWGALRLGWRNGPAFPAIVGLAYALWALALVRPADPLTGVGELALRAVLPVAPWVVLGVLYGVLKAFTHDRRRRSWLLAGIHVLMQAIAVLVLVKLGEWIVTEGLGHDDLTARWRWAVVVPVGVVGTMVGCWVLALYLVLADWWDVNTNELFAAQGIDDYKCFLRLHIDRTGNLTIYPIRVERVCRRWQRGPGTGQAGDTAPLLVPASEPPVALIEPPFVVRRNP